MAKVSSFILCESVQSSVTQNANGGIDIRPNIMSPFSSVQPVAIPGNYSFAIFFTICDIDNDDKKSQSNLQVKITAPDGNMVFLSAVFTISSEVLSNGSFSYSIDFRNFVFTQEGNYIIDILYNDENIYKQEFNVTRKEMKL